MSQKDFVINALNRAFEIASIQRNEFVTPEHIIYAITEHVPFREVCQKMNYDIDEISTCLADEIYKYEHVSDDIEYMLERSYQAEYIMQNCIDFYAEEDGVQADLCVPGLVFAAISLTNSMVSNLLNSVVSDTTLFLSELSKSYKWAEMNNSFEVKRNRDFAHDKHFEHDEDEDFYDSDFDEMNNNTDEKTEDEWKKFTVCLNDNIKNYNPLIGREKELERTIQVLCRKDKNNPLHIGEPGVGKTSIVRGLAALIEGGKVPERLRNYRIYQIDLAGMLAGTQYRGEFEKRIKMVMDGKVNRKSGKKILTAVFEEDADPQEYADKNGLAIVADASAIEPSIKKVLDSNEKAVAEYLAGNTKNIQFLIGQSMRELRGKADPKTVKDILEKLLNELK